MKVIPSILTNDPEDLKEKLKRAEGVVDRVSIDIIDGVFANNKTVDPGVLEEIDTPLKIDYQLMTKEPVNWVERCVRGQADRIIGHVEMMTSQVEFIGKVGEVGLGVGLGLDMETPAEKIDSAILTDLDVVLVMSVPAGFGGQKFEPLVIEKIQQLDEIRSNDATPFVIQDDGGITFEYIDDLRLAGVDEVSIGNRIFDGDLKTNINRFLKAAYRLK